MIALTVNAVLVCVYTLVSDHKLRALIQQTGGISHLSWPSEISTLSPPSPVVLGRRRSWNRDTSHFRDAVFALVAAIALFTSTALVGVFFLPLRISALTSYISALTETQVPVARLVSFTVVRPSKPSKLVLFRIPHIFVIVAGLSLGILRS